MRNFFTEIQNKKVLILGDVMVDAYYSGPVERISPEAPVPIIRLTDKDDRLGGAANVAKNIKSLGAIPIICSVIGDDAKGDVFLSLLEKNGMTTEGLLRLNTRPTTVKTRVMSDYQQMIRIDEESTDDISHADEDSLLSLFSSIIKEQKIEAVIFEDYNKGVLTTRVISEALRLCSDLGVLTTVDPKKENFFAYRNCTLFKPNLKEVSEGLKLDNIAVNQESMDNVADALRDRLDQRYTLLTLSEYGVFYEENGESGMLSAHKRDIADVSGAGDTVIATVTLCLLAGASIREASHIANLAGGLVCEYVGVVPIDLAQLKNEVNNTILS